MARVNIGGTGFTQRGVFDQFNRSMRTAIPVFLQKKRLEFAKEQEDQEFERLMEESKRQHIQELLKLKAEEDKAALQIATDNWATALETGNQELGQSSGRAIEGLTGLNLLPKTYTGTGPMQPGENRLQYTVPEVDEAQDLKNTPMYNDLTKLLGREPTLEEYEELKRVGQRQPQGYFDLAKTAQGFKRFNKRTGEWSDVPGEDLPIPADVDLVSKKEEAKGMAKRKVDRINAFPKIRNGHNSLIKQWGVVDKKLDQAIKKVSPWTAGAGAWIRVIPATPQKNLMEILETIKANIGFDKLQDMRNNSPTGGALGQVSEFENKLLQAVQGSLDQSQEAAQLKENLEDVKEILRITRALHNQAYKTDYGEFIEKEAGTLTADEYLKNFGK